MAKPSKPDPKEWPFYCAKCDVTFVSMSDLEQHLQGLHHRLSESDKAFLHALKIQPWDEE